MEGNFDMKKLFSIALSMLMLISCFAISVSAEEVNYAQNENASYSYAEDLTESWFNGFSDDACELLTDGNVPYGETPFESVSVQGSSKMVTIVFDLGATYPDVKTIKFCGVWDSNTFEGGNRSFSGEKTIIRVSQDGENFERNQNFNMTKENWSEDGSENGWYNFVFTFDENVAAKKIELTIWSPTYVLSLGEIQIIGGGAAPVEPAVSEEESSEEESVDEPAESTDESVAESTADESTDESVAESEAEESTEESKAEESKTESKAEESKTESKSEESKTESKTETSSSSDEDDSSMVVVIVIIIVAVVAIAVVVVIIMKKRG